MNTHLFLSGCLLQHRRLDRVALFLPVLLTLSLVLAGCSASSGSAVVSPAEQEAAFRQIAADYIATGDLGAAQVALEKLELANPAQLVVALAEADLRAGRPRENIEPLARLCEALGVRSSRLVAYLAPTPVPVVLAATAVAPLARTEALPTVEPTAVVLLATEVPPTATTEPTPAPTVARTDVPPSATPAPQKPRVLASSTVNLRSGPGRAYPVIGRLTAGQEVDIVGRNASGDWWRLEWSGRTQAWVAGTVVRVLGAIDTVAEVEDIPPAPTAAPRPTAAPAPPPAQPQPTAAPKTAGPDFRLIVRRLWTLEENGGHLAGGLSVNCEGNGHVLHVFVRDAAGNPLDGVTIKEAGGVQQELVSGSKGSGMAEFDLYPPGKDVYIIRDADGRQVTSDTGAAPTVPAAIGYDLLRGSHYCTTDEDCARFVNEYGCGGHYSWDLIFQRSY